MWTLYYRHPRLLILSLALIIAAGLGSFLTMPRKEDPTLTQRFGLVLTRFDGAGAAEVESQVTEPLEQLLREVDGVIAVHSLSRYGISVIEIELAESVVDVDPLWSQVRDKLSEASERFPPGVSNARLDLIATDVDAWSMVVALVWERDGEPPLGIMSRLSHELSTRLRNLAGTRHTSRFGALQEEVRIEIPAERLAALGLSPSQLAAAVAAADARLPAGRIVGAAGDVRVDVRGEFESLDQIRQVALKAGAQGEIVRVEHVGAVVKAWQDPPGEVAFVGGSRAVTVSARAAEDTRLETWAAGVRRVLSEFETELPPGIRARILFDQSRYVEDRLRGLVWNLALGAVLVVLLTGLIMGLRSAVMVGIALPLTCLAVFAGLNLLGIPLHQMSVTGLVIALGLLIDNAIITVHDLRSRLRAHAPTEALAMSVSHLVVPLGASTLTTALAFAPLFLMPGPAGEFVGSIGVSVVLALFSSLVISLTVVATLTAWFPGHADGSTRSWQTLVDNGLSSPRWTQAYGRILDTLLARPLTALAIALFLPALGFGLAVSLPEEFFPAADRSEFQIQLKLGPNASIDQTAEVAHEVWRTLTEIPGVEESFWFVGGTAPKFYYNMIGGQDGDSGFAQGVVRMTGENLASGETVAEIQRLLQLRFPSAQVLALQFGQGPPVNAPIELHVLGPDLERIREIGDQIQGFLARHPAVVTTRSTLGTTRPFLRFEPDLDALRSAGFEPVSISRSLSGLLDGALGGNLIEGSERLPVRIRVSPEQSTELQSVRDFSLAPPDGATEGWIPVSALGTLAVSAEDSAIRHRNGQRANSVQAFLNPGILPSIVLAETLAQAEPILSALPPGYTVEVGGDSGERDEAVSRLLGPAAVLLVLMVATLVLAFNSFRLAGIIALVAAGAVGLGLTSLWLFGLPFGFMAIVGIMGLIGVAVNDAIVILSGIREAGCGGDHRRVREVVVKSTRHVLSATLTTVAGFMPLLLDGGRFWPPLATAIAGGLVGATLLSLVFVPSAWLLQVRVSGWLTAANRWNPKIAEARTVPLD